MVSVTLEQLTALVPAAPNPEIASLYEAFWHESLPPPDFVVLSRVFPHQWVSLCWRLWRINLEWHCLNGVSLYAYDARGVLVLCLHERGLGSMKPVPLCDILAELDRLLRL